MERAGDAANGVTHRPGQALDKEVEGLFRLWAFRMAYEKMFADEPDMTIRFGKAIAYSTQPIQSADLARIVVARLVKREGPAKGRESRQRLAVALAAKIPELASEDYDYDREREGA